MVDHLAYSNKLRFTDPRLKFSLAIAVVVLCLLSTSPLVGITAVVSIFIWLTQIAKSPWRTVINLLFAEATFLALSLIGIIVSISLSEPVSMAWRTAVGPLWLASSPTQIDQATLVFARTFGAMSALNSLALTTPLIDLISMWQRWRVPDLLIDLMTIMYRFIFVLLATLRQMSIAQTSRLGQAGNYRQRMNNAALLGSRLFINAFQRSQRLETALRARGYDGVLPVLPMHYNTPTVAFVGATVIIILLSSLVWII